MKPILWSILSVFVGVVVGGLVVGLVELPGYFIHPPPPGLDMNDVKAAKTYVAGAPDGVFLGVALAWALGPLAASFVTCYMARRAVCIHAAIIGAIFILLDVANYGLPHPTWLMVAGVVLTPLTACAGAAIAQKFLPATGSGPKPYDMREKNMAC